MRDEFLKAVTDGLRLISVLVCFSLIRATQIYAASNANVDIVAGAGRTYSWWGDSVESQDPPPVNDSTHVSLSVDSAYFYGITDTNLSTQTISAFSSTSSAAIPLDGAVGRASGVSIFNTADDLFTLLGPTSGTAVDITANLNINGTLYSDNYSHWGWTSSYAKAYGGLKNGTSYAGIPILFDLLASGTTPVNQTVSLPLNVVAGNPFPLSYAFNTQIQGVDGHESWSDFGSTGRLSFNLPAGTSITSEAGFYQASVVPEPVSGVLFVFGAAALAGAGRLRRKA